MNHKLAVGMVGIISIFASIFVFLLLIDSPKIVDWSGIYFIVAAEILITAYLIIMSELPKNTTGTLFQNGTYGILAIYIGSTVLTSILFIVWLRDFVTALIAFQVAIFTISLIALILVYVIAHRNAKIQNEEMKNVAEMKMNAAEIRQLKAESKNPEIKAELEQLYEIIQFSDNSTATETDEAIKQEINGLKKMISDSEKDEEIKKKIEEIKKLAEKRKMEVYHYQLIEKTQL
jgi:hypothetical protein